MPSLLNLKKPMEDGTFQDESEIAPIYTPARAKTRKRRWWVRKPVPQTEGTK